ncbi:MAG: N-acetylmuramoyl-L-alanine amidase [Lacunisphaera sp.]
MITVNSGSIRETSGRGRARIGPRVFATMVVWLGFSISALAQGGTVPSKVDSPAPTPPAPLRSAPTRPGKLWPFTRIHGIDYVSLRDFAEHFGMKLAWKKTGFTQTLSDPRGVRLEFESNQRDYYFDGLRIFMGEPAVLDRDALWISKLDLIKNVIPIFRPGEYAVQLPAPPRTIVIDPGHGGTDPGKQNLRLRLDEKDLTLDVSLRLRKILEQLGYRVLMTRTTDKRFSNNPIIDLPLRADFANKESADLYLSIHFNAVDHDPQKVVGTETYVFTPQFQISTQPEQEKAMIGTHYPGNQQDFANALLGYNLHRQMIGELKGSDRGYKRYRLAVLRTLHCPGALVEAAYLSNDAEARKLATPEFRQKIAEALADGIRNYAATLAALHPAPPAAAPR